MDGGGLGRWVSVLVLVAITAWPGPTHASTTDVCQVVQITSTVGGFEDRSPNLSREAVSGDGTLATFRSAGQVFLYDGNTEIVTPVSSGPSRVTLPVISADGSTVAFSAEVEYRFQAFTYDVQTQTTTQITSAEAQTLVTSISADGSKLAFVRNPGGEFGPWSLLVHDLIAASTVEVVHDAGGIVGATYPTDAPALSPDGSRLAFISLQDLTGENPDRHQAVFLYHTVVSDPDPVQVTSTIGGPHYLLQFTDSGTTLVFDGRDGQFGRFRYDIASDTTHDFASPSASAGLFSEDGSRFVFTSRSNVLGSNPEGNSELFSLDLTADLLTEHTSTTATAYGTSPRLGGNYWDLAVSAHGQAIAFTSNANLRLGNPDHNEEVYLATTCDPAPRPDTSIATAFAGTYSGNDIYSAAPLAAQKQSATIPTGATRAFYVQIQNDREETDTFTINATGSGAAGYRVRYYRSGTDITAAVNAGTYTIGPLDPGQTATLNIKITAVAAPRGSVHKVDITARSTTNPAARDFARARVTRR